MSSVTRVYKKTSTVIRQHLSRDEKKLIMKFVTTHKRNAKKATTVAKKEAVKEAKEAAKEAKKVAKEADKKAAKEAAKEAKKAEGVKRKPSVFANYMKMVRSTIKIENPEASFGDISKIVGQNWKKLSDEEKQQYKVE